MLKRLAFLSTLLLVACVVSETGHTCSTFCLGKGDKTVFGKNFDYHMGYGVVIINKRNVAKHAATFSNPAQWVSKYGSVTFNMYGREMPMGGMNEAGLVLDNMWMDSSTYPEPDSRPAVNTLQWVQYQLDNCSTVAEVIATDSLIRINSDSPSKIHYLVCDRNGACASIEFIDGKRVIHSGKSFPVHVLTNSRYDTSLDFLNRFDGDEKNEEFIAEGSSLGRFVWASKMLDAYTPGPPGKSISYAFEILDKVGSQEYTWWSIVYDIANRRIHFRTKTNPTIRFLDLAAFDFSCDQPVKTYDLDSKESGDVSGAFEDYSYEKNRALIMKTFSQTEFLKEITPDLLEILARYPESLACMQ